LSNATSEPDRKTGQKWNRFMRLITIYIWQARNGNSVLNRMYDTEYRRKQWANHCHITVDQPRFSVD